MQACSSMTFYLLPDRTSAGVVNVDAMATYLHMRSLQKTAADHHICMQTVLVTTPVCLRHMPSLQREGALSSFCTWSMDCPLCPQIPFSTEESLHLHAMTGQGLSNLYVGTRHRQCWHTDQTHVSS